MSAQNSTASAAKADEANPAIERILIASLFLIWSIVALFIYALFFIAVLITKELRRSAFFRGQLSVAVTDVAELFAFLVIGAPSTFLGYVYSDAANSTISSLLVEIGWFHYTPMLVVQSANRLLAICYPHHVYEAAFGGRRVWIFIAAAWLVGIAMGTATMWPCCYVLYFPSGYSFGYNIPVYGSEIISYVDTCFSTTNLVGVLIVNAFIFRYIRKSNAVQSTSTTAGNRLAQRRRKRERGIFVQLFIVTTITLAQELSFIVLPMVSSSRFAGLFSSVVYLVSFSTNGVVFVFFNESVNSAVKENFCILQKKLSRSVPERQSGLAVTAF